MPQTARPQHGRALACVLGPAEGRIGATGAAGGRTPAEAGDRDLSDGHCVAVASKSRLRDRGGRRRSNPADCRTSSSSPARCVCGPCTEEARCEQMSSAPMGETTCRRLPSVGGVRIGQGQDPRDLSTTGGNGAEPYSRLAGVYDEIVVDGCHDRWAAHLNELWSSDAADVRTVLDLCCGTGLMAAELIALGYRVVGVDGSSAMLARARQRVGPATVLMQQTLPGLTIGGVFDAAVCTFDALNYLTPADLGATLTAVGRRLRPGGWFVFDLHTDALMDFTVSHPVVEGEAAGYRFALNSVVDVGARTCDTRIDVTRADDGDTFAERHRQYFHRRCPGPRRAHRCWLRFRRHNRRVHPPAPRFIDHARDLDRALPRRVTATSSIRQSATDQDPVPACGSPISPRRCWSRWCSA